MQIHVKNDIWNKYFTFIYTDNNYELKPQFHHIWLETCNCKKATKRKSVSQR
jgi:hypothetical protein